MSGEPVCGCEQGMGHMDRQCHSYGLCHAQSAERLRPVTADVQRELAANAIREWLERPGSTVNELAADVQRLIADAEKRAAAAALEPVRVLHRRVDRGSGPECMECVKHLTLSTGWPCATIAALDPAGAASGETT